MCGLELEKVSGGIVKGMYGVAVKGWGGVEGNGV